MTWQRYKNNLRKSPLLAEYFSFWTNPQTSLLISFCYFHPNKILFIANIIHKCLFPQKADFINSETTGIFPMIMFNVIGSYLNESATKLISPHTAKGVRVAQRRETICFSTSSSRSCTGCTWSLSHMDLGAYGGRRNRCGNRRCCRRTTTSRWGAAFRSFDRG